jgi:hypothetical protein
MFDDQVLESYINTFYGYGNYRGRWWFVGMEEGGGTTIEHCKNRIMKWKARGRNELDDLQGFHSAIALKEPWVKRHFAEQPKIQTTWGKLIRIVLAAEGRPTSLDDVKIYQRDQLGRSTNNNCLLELLPLPSPSTGHWVYEGHSALPQIQARQEYKEYYAPRRAEHIRERVEEYRPPVVVFYSVNWWYRQWWQKIAGVDFAEERIGSDLLLIGNDMHTVYAITKHPAAKGITNDYFHQVGRRIAARLR